MHTEIIEKCPGCSTGIGQLHVSCCDLEQCPYCGNQFLSCFCEDTSDAPVPNEDRLPWQGYFRGTLECEEFGFYTTFAPGLKEWPVVGPDDPDAVPNYNRLLAEATWDRKLKRFVKKVSAS